MRTVLNIVGTIALVGGLAALVYALIIALPYLNTDAISAATGGIYQKATFYGVVAVAAFGFAGLCMANASAVAYTRPKV